MRNFISIVYFVIIFSLSLGATSVFDDDMESGTSQWAGTGDWAQTTSSYHSSSHSWTDSPGSIYDNNLSVSLSSVSFSMISTNWNKLTFWHNYDLENNRDFAYVEISTGTSGSWVTLQSFTGNSNGWTQEEIDLSSYDGQSLVKLRFRMTTDESGQLDGWYIDDVAVASTEPTNLSATALSSSSIRLNWTDNSGSKETAFHIERKTGSFGTYSEIATVGANTITYTNYSLASGTTYYYRVRGYDGSSYSSYSNEGGAQTQVNNPPAAPSNLIATAASSDTVNLTWNDNSSNEYGFKIDRKEGAGGSWGYITTVSQNTEAYSNTSGLKENTQYFYRVYAYNAGGNSYSNEDDATTGADVTMPTFAGIQEIEGTGPTSMKLKWNAASDQSTPITYNIYMATTSGGQNFTAIDYATTNLEYSVGGLTTDQEYFFVVRAEDNSVASNEESNTIELSAVAGQISDLVLDGETVSIYGEYTYSNIILRNGATINITTDDQSGNGTGHLVLYADTIDIGVGCSINASEKSTSGDGDGINNTPGSGGASGAAHIGYGGRGGEGEYLPQGIIYDGNSSNFNTYGSNDIYIENGSFGFSNRKGGGTIRLIGNQIILNGKIEANGESAVNGEDKNSGASGGSVVFVCDLFEGNGTIEVKGGNGAPARNGSYGYLYGGGGGGGGGAIRYFVTTNNFTGSNKVDGGAGGAAHEYLASSWGASGGQGAISTGVFDMTLISPNVSSNYS